MNKQDLKQLIREEISKVLTEDKLNMQKVWKILKNSGLNPKIEDGNRMWIKSIVVGSNNEDEKDWGRLKITSTGALYGDDLWGRDIDNEQDVIPALQQYIQDQKDYFKDNKSNKYDLTTPTSIH
tara:strand:- start:8 stop:379 length:372 start_codon:yes stop_codon:yes gene_type:complete